MKKKKTKWNLRDLYIEIYEDGVVFTGKEIEIGMRDCNVTYRHGEDAPEVSDGQLFFSTKQHLLGRLGFIG